MGGVVDQWRGSGHSHPQESEIGTGACGNCHGIDGIAQRLASNYLVTADAGAVTNVPQGHLSYRGGNGQVAEIAYGGATTVGLIHCSTCHDFNPTTDPHVTGSYQPHQAPLRVSTAAGTGAYLEASPAGATEPVGQSVELGLGNACVFCHKSRKDVTLYVTASNVISTSRWGPHEGPQADIVSGKGGYQFASKAYSSGQHSTLANACVTCHMQPAPLNNDVPDHSMKPSLALCTGSCHSAYTGKTFDVDGGQSLVRGALVELQAALNAKGLLTRSASAPYAELQPDELTDGQFHLDSARPGSGPGGANQTLNAADAGALYNFLVIARGKDFGVHNPRYTKQLLWDSILQIKGSNPTSLPQRP